MVLALGGPAFVVAVGTASPADESCPGPRQVSEALEARLPGILTPDRVALPHEALRLTLAPGPAGGPLHVELSGSDGGVQLRRDLFAESTDCAALADTVALIVERHLREIGYTGPALLEPAPKPAGEAPPRAEVRVRAPPVPAADERAGPADLRLEIFAGLGLRAPVARLGDGDLALGFGLSSGRLGAVLTGALAAREQRPLGAGARATLIRAPIRLIVRGEVSFGRAVFEPGLGGGLDLLRAEASGLSGATAPVTRAAAVAEGRLAARLPLGSRSFVRLAAAGGVAVSTFDFTVDGAAGPVSVFRTPDTYIRVAVEGGLSL